MIRKEIPSAKIAAIPADKQTTLITVGVACYNIAPYLARCLDSILAQTYRNLEILVVDDGSTDDTGRICDDYAKKDPRIHVIHQENRGLGGARNRAIEEAAGEYIAFVDGDDTIDPCMYEMMLSVCRRYDSPMSVCRYRLTSVGEAVPPVFDAFPAASDVTLMDGEAALQALITEDERHVIQNAGWNKLYQKALIGTLRFPEKKKYEDVVYTAKLVAAAKRVCYLDTPLYHYVVDRTDSIMGKGVGEAILTDWIPQFQKRRRFLKEEGYGSLVDAHDYLVNKKLLLYYTEARRSKDAEKRACMPRIEKFLRRSQGQMDRVYGTSIANPHEKMRMRLFLIHPFLYNCFMDLNEGVVLPLRRRLAKR